MDQTEFDALVEEALGKKPTAAGKDAEGWGQPAHAVKQHYYRAGEETSLCGQWPYLGERDRTGTEDPGQHCNKCLMNLAPTAAEIQIGALTLLGWDVMPGGQERLQRLSWEQRLALGRWLATETASANDHPVRRYAMPSWAEGIWSLR
jgi:hypothetical protein